MRGQPGTHERPCGAEKEPLPPVAEMVERVARALEPGAFETFDRGYTQRNAFDTAAFLNAEKTVRRAKRKARAAIDAMRLPTSQMLAAAVLSAVTGDPSAEDYAATGAVLERLPPTGHPQARTVIAEIRRDYRAAINAALGVAPVEASPLPTEREDSRDAVNPSLKEV